MVVHHTEGEDGKNKQVKELTRAESKERIGSEIMKDCAMLYSSHLIAGL